LGSGNPFNVVKATLNGLTSLRDPEVLARMRQVEPDGAEV
jgi:ribosomal protein S5